MSIINFPIGTNAKRRSLLIYFLVLLCILCAIIAYQSLKKNDEIVSVPSEAKVVTQKTCDTTVLHEPELSGWIAWWIESDGYTVIDKHHKKIHAVSPGWFSLTKDLEFIEIGQKDKKEIREKMRAYNMKIYPMVVTDLSSDEIALFVNNAERREKFIKKIIDKSREYDLDGIDLDFENINLVHKEEFSTLIKELSRSLHAEDLYFSVTIQAQTGINDWSGIQGQDIELIGKMADEVRIMIYDRHGQFSEPGPITPMQWFKDVINFNVKKIPREKIVVALPTYGYIWFSDSEFRSFQYKDFITFAENDNYHVERDPKSHELKYTKNGSVGFLSDATAVNYKMEYARTQNLNRFSFWNLSGTDEEIFQKKWDDLTNTDLCHE